MTIRIFASISFAVLAAAGFAVAQQAGAVTIAMVPSLMDDLNKGERNVVDKEFPILVKEFTGLSGTLVRGENVKDVADKIESGAAQFGVFQGIEFAEAQASAKSLKPLLLAEYRAPTQTALVIAKKDGEIASLADLKGKDVAILKQGKEHIRRYTAKVADGDPAKFFAKITEEPNRETIIQAVAAGRIPAAIIDRTTLDLYKEVSPQVVNLRLKIVGESEPFPTTVIAYDPSKADPAVVKRFESGMFKANKSEKGRDFMSTFRITQFTPVTANFDKALAAIRAAYPR